MFSLEGFYTIITKNLLEPFGIVSYYFQNFGSTDARDLISDYFFEKDEYAIVKDMLHNFYFVTFYDQEPLTDTTFYCDFDYELWLRYAESYCKLKYFQLPLKILANSEHSLEKNKIIETFNFRDWYYFFHGFAALDWFRNLQYLPMEKEFSNVFICFNNLINDKRNYRLSLIGQILDRGLDSHGLISLNSTNLNESIRQELFSPHSLLSAESKKIIYKNLYNRNLDLTIDTTEFDGKLSAFSNIKVLAQGLFHIVTETNFYEDRIHLTEKIFKPIAARRPFILVSAPGNLKYLKSYGFKTFDKWIDESYDDEKDNDKRISMIVDQIERLCKLTPAQLNEIWNEIQLVVVYNHNHFYNEFKNIIIDELVDNFKRVLIQHNSGMDSSFDNFIDFKNFDFESVKLLLKT